MRYHAEAQMEKDFLAHSYKFGIANSDLGRKYDLTGETVQVIGLKPRNTRYPVIVRSLDRKKNGRPKQYKLDLDLFNSLQAI